MAFAVIETGGKQYRVSPGSTISIEKLETNQGEAVIFDKVLMYQMSETPVVGGPFLEGVTVEAEVVEHGKGPKIRISTYKAKKRQRRTMGHRQPYTMVKIVDINTKPAGKAEKIEKIAKIDSKEVEKPIEKPVVKPKATKVAKAVKTTKATKTVKADK